MNTFLEFLDNRKKYMVTEAFNQKDTDKMLELVEKVLHKHIDGLIPLEGFVTNMIGKDKVFSKQYMVLNGNEFGSTSMFQINFLPSSKSNYAYSIDFFKDLELLFDGKSTASLSVYTLGSSLVYFLPIIWTIASSQKYDLTEKRAIELGRSVFKNSNIKESQYYIGALPYHIIEGMSNDMIKEAYLLEDEETAKFKKDKYDKAHQAYLDRKDSPDAKQKFKELNAEYEEVRKAIAGGASTMAELKVALKHNVKIVTEIDAAMKEAEEKFKEERENPETVFKKMQGYVKMVIKGINPSVILCGAPGVGKTFRVKQQLKASKYSEGINLFTIKGKCTPRRLYLALYEYQDKGQIILIDDADALVGPNAPEDCINILKAALDSTSDDEGRLVSYGVSGKLLDDEGMEIPKRFYYRGGIIVITNWNAGKLDTALRGRSYIQDINFTTEEILEIIKKLMPAIDPEHLSAKSKIKAYDYLVELLNKDAEMEVSIRTFGICAKIFEATSGDSDFTEDDAKSMIREQMRLQASRISGRGNKGKY